MKKIRVLIVEDDTALRETWEMFFENFGFYIHTAANGLEAIEIIRDHAPEIIVTDLQMPVKDGYFVLEYIKSKNIDAKVWVCSGHLLTKENISSKYKIDEILTKPFDMLVIVKEIISIISKNNSKRI